MSEPLLALVLLCTASGLMLASSPLPEQSVATLAAFVLTIFGIRSDGLHEWSYQMTWAAMASCGVVTWLGRRMPLTLALALSALCGLCAGVLITQRSQLLILPVIPASAAAANYAIGRGHGLVVHVLAAWLVAIAALNATLCLLPVTPGYAPDHLE